MLAAALLLGACGNDSETEARARALVENTFAQKVKPGPFGTEALGKGVWFRAPAIHGGCLQDKDWGHMDDPAHSAAANRSSTRRISPNYEAQNAWVGRTDKGWCIFLGNDLQLEVTQVNFVADAWVVDYALSMQRPGGWWECVDESKRAGYVRVLDEDGELSLEEGGEDRITLYQGACPAPLPDLDTERKGRPRPAKKPPSPPTRADAIAAAKRLDDALWEGDFAAAVDATACYNLYEKQKFGACAPSEFLNLGPLPRGGTPRMSDGPPWSMNAFKSLDDLGKPTRDPKDPTLYHVPVKPARGKGRKRTMAIQWVDGEWKVVAVLGRLSEGLATVQVVYDLDRPDRRDIFERRMKGEAIGEDGTPLDAGVRYGYVEPDEE